MIDGIIFCSDVGSDIVLFALFLVVVFYAYSNFALE